MIPCLRFYKKNIYIYTCNIVSKFIIKYPKSKKRSLQYAIEVISYNILCDL